MRKKNQPQHRHTATQSYKQEVRIIAGYLGGRKLAVLDEQGLRPTADRIRETLFNWLSHLRNLSAISVLDVFAGSGALGFESLSRGADEAIFIEKNKKVAMNIEHNISTMGIKSATVITKDSLTWLSQKSDRRFDVVFVDPPFYQQLAEKTLNLLINNHYIDENSLIYLEVEKEADIPLAQFTIIREKIFGNVCVRLLNINKCED